MTGTPAAAPPPPTPLATPLVVIIMGVSYLLVLGYLAAGLALQRRQQRKPERKPDRERGRARGWRPLILHMLATALGGYLLLMAVTVGYYQGVAHVGGGFLGSAFSGGALLIGISLPVFLIASWLEARRCRR